MISLYETFPHGRATTSHSRAGIARNNAIQFGNTIGSLQHHRWTSDPFSYRYTPPAHARRAGGPRLAALDGLKEQFYWKRLEDSFRIRTLRLHRGAA